MPITSAVSVSAIGLKFAGNFRIKYSGMAAHTEVAALPRTIRTAMLKKLAEIDGFGILSVIGPMAPKIQLQKRISISSRLACVLAFAVMPKATFAIPQNVYDTLAGEDFLEWAPQFPSATTFRWYSSIYNASNPTSHNWDLWLWTGAAHRLDPENVNVNWSGDSAPGGIVYFGADNGSAAGRDAAAVLQHSEQLRARADDVHARRVFVVCASASALS